MQTTLMMIKCQTLEHLYQSFSAGNLNYFQNWQFKLKRRFEFRYETKSSFTCRKNSRWKYFYFSLNIVVHHENLFMHYIYIDFFQKQT